MIEIDTPFVSLDEVQTANLAVCGDGLFQTGKDDPFGDVVVTSDGDEHFAIYLRAPKGPLYNAISSTNRPRGVGLFWPTPAIEVDRTTMYRMDVEGERPGELIVTPGKLEMVVLRPDGWDMTHRLPLWQAIDTAASEPIGFRSWRLVSVFGDRRRVIYTHSAPA